MVIRDFLGIGVEVKELNGRWLWGWVEETACRRNDVERTDG